LIYQIEYPAVHPKTKDKNTQPLKVIAISMSKYACITCIKNIKIRKLFVENFIDESTYY